MKGRIASIGEGAGKSCWVDEEGLGGLMSLTGELPEGDFILLTNMTTPSMVPLMKRAKGVATITGGLLCHAAIVSREFGIPCVVAVGRDLYRIKDGVNTVVDGNIGEVWEYNAE